jgi:signal transduction histidine kinase
MKESSDQIKSLSLPWWTWPAPLVIIYLSDQLSQLFIVPTGSILFYLPIPIGIVLIHLWGPRVLLGVFINAIVSTAFWETSHPEKVSFIVIHETASVFASWYLFSYKQKGKIWLPDIYSVLQFIALGILIPVTVNSGIIFLSAVGSYENIWIHLSMVWTADFASSFALTLPALYFLTPWMEQHNLSRSNGSEYIKPSAGLRLVRQQRVEIVIALASLILISILLPVERYWFIHGLFCVYIGVRFGFGLSLLANVIVFLFTYLVPFVTMNYSMLSWALESDLINIHFGMCLLSMTACITGRVISDLKLVQRKLSQQFKELVQTHDELDRFVYSASHDLSAPLKSILGLITISRLEKDFSKHAEYINKIEASAVKLDSFIKEILDYSRNSRLENEIELINFRELIHEVFENFKHVEHFHTIDISIRDQVPQIKADRMRMKIILNNLLSNAIKYQCYNNGHKPSIAIQSELNHKYVLIHVKDNGNGIREEYLSKIFKMFFRGTTESSGSGLGLYIAKEAAEKMEGKITVSSSHGHGSIFTVYLPKIKLAKDVR